MTITILPQKKKKKPDFNMNLPINAIAIYAGKKASYYY